MGRTTLFNRVKQQAHYFYACIIAHVGMLSHWIQKSMQDETNVDFLLVDRASTRYKVGTITVHYTVIINSLTFLNAYSICLTIFWYMFIKLILTVHYNFSLMQTSKTQSYVSVTGPLLSRRRKVPACIKPVTDEQVLYDKFLCDKFYLLVCTRNFDNFFYDKCTCSKASMLAFEQVHLS